MSSVFAKIIVDCIYYLSCISYLLIVTLIIILFYTVIKLRIIIVQRPFSYFVVVIITICKLIPFQSKHRIYLSALSLVTEIYRNQEFNQLTKTNWNAMIHRGSFQNPDRDPSTTGKRNHSNIRFLHSTSSSVAVKRHLTLDTYRQCRQIIRLEVRNSPTIVTMSPVPRSRRSSPTLKCP
jgi:hypothetical protein